MRQTAPVVGADTPSAAAGATLVAGTAAVFPAATAVAMPCRSPAAIASISGCAVTNGHVLLLTEASRPGGRPRLPRRLGATRKSIPPMHLKEQHTY